jgi:hypothetical protein
MKEMEETPQAIFYSTLPWKGGEIVSLREYFRAPGSS